MLPERFDKVIFGGGLYGLYAAERCGNMDQRVCVLERDAAPFSRATYINQARVHMGYHYPRSLTTALKSAGYFNRFVEEFEFCINGDFDQVYATSARLGWTTASEFQSFCDAADIPCEEVPTSKYFKKGMCDGAFLTKEYTYDALLLKDHFLKRLDAMNDVQLICNERPVHIEETETGLWTIKTESGRILETPYILNATYAGVNDIHSLLGFTDFPIKYELCEIILCDPGEKLKDVGITVMDGPFFSIMPFGCTGMHSLTSVTFTPHYEHRGDLAVFPCQAQAANGCAPGNLCNCDECATRPASAWPLMSALANKYLMKDYCYTYKKSLFSMKPIMLASEVDDSRPTVIKVMNSAPTFVSVLSGKINTVYDLDPYLDGSIDGNA